MNFQKMKNYADTNINESSQIDEQEIYQLIKTGGSYRDLVIQARQSHKGDKIYEKNKRQVPAILWHGIFSNYKNTQNLLNLTNFLHCDIDGIGMTEDTRTHLSIFPFIRAIWKSFGGNGWGFTVQCDNLTKDNIKLIYNSLGSLINLSLDVNNCKITQANALSYDPEIYINPNPTIYSANISDVTNNFKSNKGGSYTYIIKKEREHREVYDTHNYSVNYKTRLSEEEYSNNDFVITEEGRPYVEVYYKRFGIEEGERKTTLMTITKKLIFNNPDSSYDNILERVQYINNHCNPSLSENEVKYIVDWCWSKYQNGELYIKTRNKYIWFNPNIFHTKNKKLKIAGQQMGIIRRNRTKAKINIAISDLYNEGILITQSELQKRTGKSESTIKRYWKDLKEEIESINENIRENRLEGNVDYTTPDTTIS